MPVKILFLSLLFITQAFGQKEDGWKLKMDKEGIVVFSKSLNGSRFKAVKVECTLETTLSQLVTVLLDIKGSKEWLYSTKSCYLLRQVSPSELYYYSEVSIPWPVNNRDFVAHLIVVQDPRSKIVTIKGPAVQGYFPEKPNVVRITNSESNWLLEPVGRNAVRIEYTLHVDPGGNVPPWLINLFVAKGPYETFKKLRDQIKKPLYKNVHLSFIKD